MNKPKHAPKNKKTKLPTGKEVMKRRTPEDFRLRPARFESDPKKAYSPEQLAEIGAITLKWNQIEGSIDFIGAYILYANTPIWLQIATDKALGTKAKLSLLRECLKHFTLLDDKAKGCAYDCFAELEQCRAYRNAIIHHHIYDHEKGIGSYIDESRSPYQILVSIEALKALYGMLCALLSELHEIDLLFRMETDARRFGRFIDKKMRFEPFSEEKLKESIIPEHVKLIVALQKSRKALQKLPQFPDADLIRSMNNDEESE
jgi:hypothetical protein